MKFLLLLKVTAAITMFAASGIATAATFTDGDFSVPTPADPFQTVLGGTNIGPWLVSGSSVDLIGNYWNAPPSGGNSVDLNGDAAGGLIQTFDLDPGNYLLSFFCRPIQTVIL
jgi:hypothetical protein